MLSMQGGRTDSVWVVAAAGALVAVVCCAGLPLLGTVLGGLTLAAVVGVAAGIVVLAGVLAVALIVLRMRRRRGCTATRRVTR